VMEGQGLRARSYDPLAAAMPLGEAQARMARIATVTKAAAGHMPAHGDFVARIVGATASSG